MAKPRIDVMSGTFDTSGACDGCGKKVKRSKTFRAGTMERLQELADEWAKSVLLRCASCRRKS